jgi:16S rRNA (guanine966-N2)-methyltransferase
MAVKILGGIARGFSVLTPKTNATRPTSVLIRRRLFDWRQSLEGYTFIDLFAGSGAMGFEALSRGSNRIFLNDILKNVFFGLVENKQKIEKAFNFSSSIIELSQLDAKLWLERNFVDEITGSSNVIFYIDPPYERHQLYFEILSLLRKKKFSGEVWLESDKLKGPEKEDLVGLFCSVIKTVEQGDHFVLVGKLV